MLVQVFIRDGVLELREYASGQPGHDAIDVDDSPVEVELLFELQLPVLQFEGDRNQDFVGAEAYEIRPHIKWQRVVCDVRGDERLEVIELDLWRPEQTEILIHSLEGHVLGAQVSGLARIVGIRWIEVGTVGPV